MSDPKNLSLAKLAASYGEAISCASNLPLDLDDPGSVWLVESGAVDIFLIQLQEGEVQVAPRQLMRVEQGRLLLSFTPQQQDRTLSVIGKGLPGTVLRQLPLSALGGVQPEQLGDQIDKWVRDLAAALARDLVNPQLPDIFVDSSADVPEEGNRFSTRREVNWVQVPSSISAECLFMGIAEVEKGGLMPDGDMYLLPLTPDCWLDAAKPQRLTKVFSSQSLVADGRWISALNSFHKLVIEVEQFNQVFSSVDQVNLDRVSTLVRSVDEDRARRWLFEVPNCREHNKLEEDGSELTEALRVIGEHEGFHFRSPSVMEAVEISDMSRRLIAILDSSGVRGRKVRLDGEDRWWSGDSGAMLAFRADDNRPVALLPRPMGGYRIFDPATGDMTNIEKNNHALIQDEVWQFYGPLDAASVRPRDLFRTFNKRLAGSFSIFATAGLVSGLIMLLPAVALGLVFNRVLPSGELGLSAAIATALGGFALIWGVIYILQAMALMRFEGSIVSRIEAAFWDRLLRLPYGFLNRFSAADRAMRGMAFQRLRDSVQGVMANNVLSLFFLAPSLIFIFIYDHAIGAVTAVFGLLALAATVLMGSKQIPPYQRILRASHRLAGIVSQFVNGISKLRSDGAEAAAYAEWARHFGEQQQAELELGVWSARLKAFGSALPLLGAATVIGTGTVIGAETLAIGDFLFIFVALMLFVTGLVRLCNSFEAVAAVAPELTQIQPFLDAVPEPTQGQQSVGDLGGDLLFDHVSFRYEEDGPLILDDVSIHARRGEMIAIAGASGSGKSTLLRLALGLIMPTTGTVYFDGRDLRQLNVKQVRQKIGTVPQESYLYPQDLWDNIAAGQHALDSDTIWTAAKAAAIDKTIMKFPMQMLTCVGDSLSVLSGGETKQITIARALTRNPRIMLLDEATNSLDNENQRKVMSKLSELSMTRIFIAHRLSTLRYADRIYVMDAGKLVEQGTYDELVSGDGLFRELIRRQES